MAWRIDDRLWVAGDPKPHHVRPEWDVLLTVCTQPPKTEGWERLPELYHVPLKDGKTIETQQYWKASAIAITHLHAGDTVVINCHAGRNRSCLIATLVLLTIYPELSPTLAIDWVRERRPNALNNPYHVDWLLTS